MSVCLVCGDPNCTGLRHIEREYGEKGDYLYIENLEKQLEAAHKDYDRLGREIFALQNNIIKKNQEILFLKKHRFCLFTDEELEEMMMGWNAGLNDGFDFEDAGYDVYQQVKTELERRKTP